MLIFSDAHFDNHADFGLPWKDGCNTRLKTQLEVLEKVFEEAWARDENFILFIGDWFHKWDAVKTPVFSMVTKVLYDLLSRDPYLKLVMLPGNHDMPDKKNSMINTIGAYAEHPKILLVEESMRGKVDGRDCVFIPYTEDHAKIVQDAHRLRAGDSDVWIFSHLDIVGAKTALDGWESDIGVTLDEIQAFAGGVFGHYHFPQQLTEGGPFSYVGSLTPLSWVDKNLGGRGVAILGAGATEPEWMGIDSPQFVEFDANDPPQQVREHDFHLIRCSREDAPDVSAFYKPRLQHMRLVTPPPIKVSGVQTRAQMTEHDPVRSWFHARTAGCELDFAKAMAYAEYYIKNPLAG